MMKKRPKTIEEAISYMLETKVFMSTFQAGLHCHQVSSVVHEYRLETQEMMERAITNAVHAKQEMLAP